MNPRITTHYGIPSTSSLLSFDPLQRILAVATLDGRAPACYIQWEPNITAFVVIQGTSYMYIGDDLGNVVVVKYDQKEAELSEMPYHIPMDIIQEASQNSVSLILDFSFHAIREAKLESRFGKSFNEKMVYVVEEQDLMKTIL